MRQAGITSAFAGQDAIEKCEPIAGVRQNPKSMNNIFYLIGVAVVIIVILKFVGIW